jgi:23S rRNA (guanosine2251-2'-O)-methyltransferase
VKNDAASEAEDLIWGLHAVSEALEREPGRVRQVLVDGAAGRAAREVADRAGALKIAVRVLHPQAFRDLARGRPFQGVAARVPPFAYADEDEVRDAAASDPHAVVLALDSIQDPQNLGSILRTSAFFGVAGVLLPRDRAAPVTPAVVRASAGGASAVPVARVTNLARSLRAFSEAGFMIAGAVASGGRDPAATRLAGPCVLVMGSEADGIRRLVRESCDVLLTIPSPGRFESLNVGVATGILVHAVSGSLRATSAGGKDG